MGKKIKKSKAAETENGMSRHLRREVLEICNSILEKCKIPFKNEWDEFVELYQLLERLQKKQQPFVLKRENRKEHLKEFLQWLKSNGVDCSSVEIADFGEEGLGLKATKLIKEGELLLSIPRKLMIASSDALETPLGPLVREDCILKGMSNVVLSLHLLCECSNIKASHWAPYLRVLPLSYTIPLYASLDELGLLKGSPSLSDIINQFRNVARQYAYFFRLFQSTSITLPIKHFCYQDYRWAVSTVMTRQNKIPNFSEAVVESSGCGCGDTQHIEKDKNQVVLIPFWDMCNHAGGHISTEYKLQENCSHCYAMQETRPDEQVRIFYGPRSNSEFLLHNGFVPCDNKHNCIPIKLGVSKNDSLFSVKAEAMARCNLTTNNTFYLSCYSSQPVESELIAFLRLFSMTPDQLMGYMGGEGVEERKGALRRVQEWQDASVELKVWSFLQTRCQLLLKIYTTTLEEDELMLKGSTQDLSDVARCMVRLRASEKSILLDVIQYCNTRMASVQQTLASGQSGVAE